MTGGPIEALREVLTWELDADLADAVPGEVLRAVLRSPIGGQLRRELGLDAEPRTLAGAPLALLRRFEERVLCHDERFLELLLRHAADAAERRALVTRVLHALPSIERRLEWLQSADMNDHALAHDALAARLTEGLAHDPEALARGLFAALDMEAPASIVRSIARPLFDAAERAPGAGSDLVLRALRAARPYARPLRKKRPGVQGRRRKKKPAAASAEGDGPLFDLVPGGKSR